ncbi:TPA: DUF551 domain-containing protein [Serratia marcescens]
MTLTTETIKLWRNNAEITAGETAENDPEHIAAKAILALTAELLANREAQPVAWEMRYWNSGYNCWHDWERITAEQHAEMSVKHATDNDYEFRVLYDAPPAPAEPDEMPRQNQNGWPLDYSEYASGWNACRAAMLAQPVSSGYTLPDDWIACSEQDPVADGAYWCWFGKEKPSVIQQRVCIWNDRNHEWCDSAVTHWMPLPAAPEGGNG